MVLVAPRVCAALAEFSNADICFSFWATYPQNNVFIRRLSSVSVKLATLKKCTKLAMLLQLKGLGIIER